MLLNIHIKNMALIDEIDVDFFDNFNVLTGETGAGKSILIDSVMLALGGKVPKDFVRQNADYGLVELLFSVEQKDLIKRLMEMEIPDVDSGQLILSRKIIGGKSVSKANGSNITITKLREIAELLLDLHAQHENQSLLKQSNHLKLLDRYGHENIDPCKEKVKKIFSEYEIIKKEYNANNINNEERKRKLDLIIFEKDEIEKASLKIGEDDLVYEEYEKALHGKNITEGLCNVSNIIENNAMDYIDRAIRELNAVSSYDNELQSLTDSVSTASDLLLDVLRSSRTYLDENTYSEEEFRNLENRLNEINHLKSKYGKTIEDIYVYKENLDIEYDKLINQEEYLKGLDSKLNEAKKELDKACELLSQKRKTVAKRLVENIVNALTDLNFLDVRFDMIFEQNEDYSAEGYDKAYFIISTNVGEEMKPLDMVASGGELSRIMLAIKSCLADADSIPTLVFDEIDSGISGRTAQMVAEKISAIAKNHQVMCITHLPQIAAMADHHYLIEKNVCDGKTSTIIKLLNSDEEIKEISRLIGGAKITDIVMESAKEMKELAGKGKVN